MNENIDTSIVLNVLRQIPLFADLNEEQHKEIIQRIVLMYYPQDYVIFKELDEGDALYIIKKGGAEIFHEPREEGDLPKKVANIGPGGFFGEMALISDLPRNASVKTTEESEVFILNKKDFKDLLQTNKAMAQQISATMIARMNDNNLNDR